MGGGVKEAPIVSFSRDGEVFQLGRGPEDPVLHLYGSKGLGAPPVSIASSAARCTASARPARTAVWRPWTC